MLSGAPLHARWGHTAPGSPQRWSDFLLHGPGHELPADRASSAYTGPAPAAQRAFKVKGPGHRSTHHTPRGTVGGGGISI